MTMERPRSRVLAKRAPVSGWGIWFLWLQLLAIFIYSLIKLEIERRKRKREKRAS
jgi:hypothetical protein